MELEQAKAILNEAISGNYLEDMPENEEEILEQAEYFAKSAEKEYNEGWGKENETVKAIHSLVSEEEVVKNPEQPAQEDTDAGATSSAFFRNLPLPQSSDDEPVQMPFDVSELDDPDVRRFHGIFNHYYSLARYALAEEFAALTAAEHLRDSALKDALNTVEKFYPDTEKQKPATLLNAEASLDEEYRLWNDRVKSHEESVTKLKALTDIYGKNVEILSREATMRQNEWDRRNR